MLLQKDKRIDDVSFDDQFIGRSSLREFVLVWEATMVQLHLVETMSDIVLEPINGW